MLVKQKVRIRERTLKPCSENNYQMLMYMLKYKSIFQLPHQQHRLKEGKSSPVVSSPYFFIGKKTQLCSPISKCQQAFATKCFSCSCSKYNCMIWLIVMSPSLLFTWRDHIKRWICKSKRKQEMGNNPGMLLQSPMLVYLHFVSICISLNSFHLTTHVLYIH